MGGAKHPTGLPLLLLLLLILGVLTIFVVLAQSTELARGKICIGTNGRMSVPSNREHHYRNLRDRYINCTYVDGNLELTWLQDENLDLSFLKYIREVTGYVLISHVDVKRVVLPSLQIIRGRTLFKLSVQEENFAFLVMLSKMNTLEMPALRDILQGSVSLFNNYNLCHVRSINWTEIMSDPSAKYVYTYNFSEPQRTCHCHASCEKGCWGEGPENCQKFSKITCSPQCHDGRCYGSGPRDCCHLFCAGGCTGPTQRECLACHNFNDDGECKQECPPMKRYNTISYSWVTNPNGKYAYGATCVKDCPVHLLKDSGACVRSCPLKKKAVNGECVPCEGPCPKTCQGVENVHHGNIDSFKDCTIIEGSLTILDHSFDGFQHVFQNFTFGDKYPEMHPSKLEVFSTLKEVTGYISIQATNSQFTNLSFLRNLEVIGGRETTEYFSSLYIVKTSLTSLGLKSLKRIRSGSVYILENNNLCFADSIKWRKLIKGDDSKFQLLLLNNRKDDVCRADGFVCHEECSEDGCWGTGEDQCLSCRNFKLGERCINNCSLPGIYEKDSKVCASCDEECEGGCYGSDSNHCVRCKNVKDGPFCVAKCPSSKYNNKGECEDCHPNCIDGCRGPENNVGERGCYSCIKGLVDDKNDIEYCLQKNEPCPDGYFSEWVVHKEPGDLRSMAGNTVCKKCHPRCKNCTAYGVHISVCQECFRYRRDENCEERCPKDHYADEEKHECLKCSSECSDGCYGPLESHCKACRNYRIYLKGKPSVNNTDFNCTASCPPEYPYKLFREDFSDPYCAKDQMTLALDEESVPAIVGGTLGCVFVFCMFLSVFCYLWWQRNKTKEAALKMTMTMMPYDDNEPLKPTNIKPNLAKLRIVKEAELRKGGILGYGAFGTVYKGVWVPEGENVKIPVAIKVLRDGSGTNVNKEILEEAYIMASVDHPNLLQLLAVCMTTQIMLVTQLMPLGCLLDYVRNNKDKIGSKPLLNWCTQISRGMHYLEERRLVHRDLAARNVLVQTPNSVKITDFGLAKLLDYNEDEYKAAGGKMPIKWLALECIQHRIFTHKSDVWAFGVTVWEILTYGGRPYEDIPAREVPDLLEKGERLPQPSICTIDVYMLMIRCWMLDAESRPSFRELAEEFAKMSRDPGRFLVIQGDRLMRLPSYTPQDERELIRSLSSAIEGEGVIMAAEEYLHPKYSGGAQPPSSSTTVSDPATPVKTGPPSLTATGGGGGFHSGDNASGPSESPQNRQNMQREKYAHLEASRNSSPSQRSARKSSHGGSKYCPDTVKILDSDMGDDDCFESEAPTGGVLGNGGPYYDDSKSSSRYGWVGDMRLDLPLDEDDYLMPSPQTMGLPTVGPSHQHYMELMTDGSDGRSRLGSRDKNIYGGPCVPGGKHLNGNGCVNGPQNAHWLGMDNPEYHLMNNARARAARVPDHMYSPRPHDHASPQQRNQQHTVGVPIPIGVPVLNPNRFATYSSSSCSSGQSNGGSHPKIHTLNPQQHPPNNNPIYSRPEESPHEYYNEIPHTPSSPRSETTV